MDFEIKLYICSKSFTHDSTNHSLMNSSHHLFPLALTSTYCSHTHTLFATLFITLAESMFIILVVLMFLTSVVMLFLINIVQQFGVWDASYKYGAYVGVFASNL